MQTQKIIAYLKSLPALSLQAVKSEFFTRYFSITGESTILQWLVVYVISRLAFFVATYVQIRLALSAGELTQHNSYSWIVPAVWAICVIPVAATTLRRARSWFSPKLQNSVWFKYLIPLAAVVLYFTEALAVVIMAQCLLLPVHVIGAKEAGEGTKAADTGATNKQEDGDNLFEEYGEEYGEEDTEYTEEALKTEVHPPLAETFTGEATATEVSQEAEATTKEGNSISFGKVKITWK